METIFLEEWLHNKIKHEAKASPEFRQLLGAGTSETPTRADVEIYQLFKLRKMLSYVYENGPFYKELFDANGIKPEDIRTRADLAQVPFSDPADLAENPNRFLCVSHGDIARVTTFTTSGTTGPQKRLFCTDGDIERITDFMGVGIRTVASRGDVIQIMLPSGTANNQADLLAKGVEKMGMVPVKAGMNRTAEEYLELIRECRPAVLFAVTPRMYRITQELQRSHTLHNLGVKTVFVTSGYLSEPMRRRLQEVWKADVHVHYGMTEMGLGVAVECHAHRGYHFNEADLLLEIVDPATGRPVSQGEGEIVFTTLTREGTPLVRYRTHDMAEIINGPCPCGAGTLLRLGKVTKRLGSTVVLEDGSQIYPSLFDELLYALPEVVDYDMSVDRIDGRDRLDFVVEVTDGQSDGVEKIVDMLSKLPLLARNIASGAMMQPAAKIVALRTLSRSGRAKKKITDNRTVQGE